MIRLLEGINNFVIAEQQIHDESPALPLETLELIFSSIVDINESDLQSITGVNKLWYDASINVISRVKLNSLNTFVDYWVKNLDEKYNDQKNGLIKAIAESEICESSNLIEIKISMADLEEKIISILESIEDDDFFRLDLLFYQGVFQTNSIVGYIFNSVRVTHAIKDLDIERFKAAKEVSHEDRIVVGIIIGNLIMMNLFNRAIKFTQMISSESDMFQETPQNKITDNAYRRIITEGFLRANNFEKAAKTNNLIVDKKLKDETFKLIILKLSSIVDSPQAKDVADATTDLNFKQQALDLVKQVKGTNL